MQKNILILSLSAIHSDPRVLRQINFLRNNYFLTVAGYTDPKIEGVRFIKINPFPGFSILGKALKAINLLFRRVDALFWNNKNILQLKSDISNVGINYSLIISNDINILPLAAFFAEKWQIPLVLDMHEYSPKEFEENAIWRFKEGRYNYSLAKQYLPKCNYITTVCDGIKEEIKKEFNVQAEIISNAPEFEDLNPQLIECNKIKIVHHGGATRSRKIENMIEVAKMLPDSYHLSLILLGDNVYIEELKLQAQRIKNISFLDAVPTKDIASFINQFDIGLYILEPNNFNNKIALPNKFFEFIQARLCIVIGPSLEMAKFTSKYDLGIVTSDFEPQTLANAIKELTPEKIFYYKKQSDKVACELSSEKNGQKFLKIIESLI